MYLVPQLKGFLLNWVPALGAKKTRMMGLLDRKRSLTISLAVWIQCTNVKDRQTPGDSKDRLFVCLTALSAQIGYIVP